MIMRSMVRFVASGCFTIPCKLLGLGLLSLSFVGCGGGSKLPCVPATCAITVDGEPFGPATAIFRRVDAKPTDRSTSGDIEKNGIGKLSTYKVGDGIPVGEYKVTVVAGGLGPSRIAGTYSNPEKSPLKIQVVKNTDVIKLDLETAKAGSSAKTKMESLGAKTNEELLKEAMTPRK